MATPKNGTQDSNENLDHAVEVKALQDSLDKANSQLSATEEKATALATKVTELEAALAKANDESAKLKGRAEAAELRVTELEADLAKGPATKKAPKEESVLVISGTDYSYLIDNVRVTPDAPVRMIRREGNLLDVHMEKGLIVAYEG